MNKAIIRKSVIKGVLENLFDADYQDERRYQISIGTVIELSEE